MTIAATRAQLAADDTLVGRALCAAWTAAVDRWLAGLVDDPDPLAVDRQGTVEEVVDGERHDHGTDPSL